KEIQYLNAKGSLTYTVIAGYPVLYGNLPLRFFFSSRRRHTSCYRDWSSDVCSSDLLPCTQPYTTTSRALMSAFSFAAIPTVNLRSEERRVGKECRSWVLRLHGIKKFSNLTIKVV